MLVGFHGYGESALAQLERLRAVRGAAPWRLVSIQALHRFYRRDGERVVASWMTREDRELMVEDNVRYVNGVLATLSDEASVETSPVFVGFSQGASMAFRAAALCSRPNAGVIVLGGDVPPELGVTSLSRIPRALLGRGDDDPLYSAERAREDERRLIAAGVTVTPIAFAGGHDWTDAFTQAAAAWLHALL